MIKQFKCINFTVVTIFKSCLIRVTGLIHYIDFEKSGSNKLILVLTKMFPEIIFMLFHTIGKINLIYVKIIIVRTQHLR